LLIFVLFLEPCFPYASHNVLFIYFFVVTGSEEGKEETDQTEETASEQRAGSAMASTGTNAPEGAGLMFQQQFFVDDTWNNIYGTLDASTVKTGERELLSGILDNPTMRDVRETGGLVTVQRDHFQTLKEVVPGLKFSDSGDVSSLANLKASDGIASSGSKMDGYTANAKNMPTSVFEGKALKLSAMVAMPQVFSYGSNVAMLQLQAGVVWNEVAIPVVCTTGSQMLFGLVRLLQPAFPYLVITSKILTLTDTADRLEAAKCLLTVHGLTEREVVYSESKNDATMRISITKYHFKKMSDFSSVYKGNCNAGLIHMLELMTKLKQSEAAKFINFPITIRSSEGKAKEAAIVYDFLINYRIGLPTDQECDGKGEDTRGQILNALKTAVDAIHTAGVIHVDLYVSNWMWKLEDGKILIKLIDFDAAHAMNETLTKHTRHRLTNVYGTGCILGKAVTATAELDNVYLQVLEDNINNKNLQNQDKKTLDVQFKVMCEHSWQKRSTA
jgi:hypothetical protein